MERKPKIFVIEGFDRIGKDTIFNLVKETFEKDPKYQWFLEKNEFYIQDIDRSALPDYKKDPDNFFLWLVKHTKQEIRDINKILESGKNVIMVRFLLTDLVYADLFERPNIVECLAENECYEIENFIMLWKSYDDYIARLECIDPDIKLKDVEYDKPTFEYVQSIYLQFANRFKRNMVIMIDNNMTQKEIANEFVSFIFDHFKFIE